MASSSSSSSGSSSTSTTSSSSPQQEVNIICSAASLLSGDLDECLSPDDDSCEAGIAAVMAFARNHTKAEPTVVVQKFDKNSPFVNTHPLQWVVNRLILHEIFGLDLFISNLSLLLQNKVDTDVSQRDISNLQASDFPLLMSNTEVNPSNSWYPFVRQVHFDKATGLALISISDYKVPLWVDQVVATKGILNYLAMVNTRNGCGEELTDYQEYLLDSDIQSVPTTMTTVTHIHNNTNEDEHEHLRLETTRCWLPVILYQDVEPNYWDFLRGITRYEHPPALIINLEHSYETHLEPTFYEETTVWVAQCPMDDENYCQHRISLSSSSSSQQQRQPQILNVDFINENLEELPADLKDAAWNTTIWELRKLADEARNNNPVAGYSDAMPPTRDGTYRACQGGECPLGSLFTEALLWFTDSDIAFTSSGGYRGPGWPAGPVTLTNLYAGLPFPNLECTGVMSGLSLFRLLNYTTSVSTFEGEDTSDGGRLLQVAGMKVSYNTQLPYSRLVAVDIWDKTTERYEPIDRLKMYKFASDSYVCGAYDPYPDLTGGQFVVDGEEPGVIGDNLVQNIVADYLTQLESPFDTSYQGRLQNHTDNFRVLDLVQNEFSCESNSVWEEASMSCIPCPSYEFVVFSDQILNYDADSTTELIEDGRVILVNREPVAVVVVLKSKPRWVQFTGASKNFGVVDAIDFTPIPLQSGESLVMEFNVLPASLGSGGDRFALGTVSFGVQDGGQYPGCTGRDAIFDVQLRVTPPTEYNHLGGFFYIGVALVGVVFLTCVIATGWVFVYRNTRVVKVMQPIFLLTIVMGVFIMASTILPMGIDDGLVSDRGCDIACMSIPWLLSTGFTISFSALFSKLWRINRLFNATPGVRRVVVRHVDVLAPFMALFTFNFGILLAWTIADPMVWERYSVEGEVWNTYGTCEGGVVSIVLGCILAVANFGALLMACSQAYRARNISDEFSESKYIGIAIYGWFQILIVGIPILFLIELDNPLARYILQTTLIFIVSMSMLLIIFVPAYFNFKKMRHHPREMMTVTGITVHSNAEQRAFVPNSSLMSAGVSRESYVKRNIPLAVMDSIVERTDTAATESPARADRVSAEAESKLLDTAARNRKRMIEQQANLRDSSMAEKVNNMMLAMQSEEDDESDDSSTYSASD